MFGFTKPLKETIASQEVVIKRIKEELKSANGSISGYRLEVTRLAAENAVLKQKIVVLEDAKAKKQKENEEFGLRWREALKNASPTVIQNMPPENSFIEEAVLTAGRRDRPDLFPPAKEKTPINPKLQAYYNRGKNNTNYKSKRKPKTK